MAKRPKLTDAEKAANVAAGLTPTGKIPMRGKNAPNTKNGTNTPAEFPPGDYRCMGTAFTAKRKNEYLRVLKESGERTLARAAVGVSERTVTKHRCEDSIFRDAEDEARRQHAAIYSQEMIRRGVTGIQKPVYGSLGGQGAGVGVVGWVTEYSDRLLMEQARRHEAEYTPKTKVETVNISSTAIGLGDLSPESQEDLRRILERELAKPPKDDPAS